jgi:hypothetical protein
VDGDDVSVRALAVAYGGPARSLRRRRTLRNRPRPSFLRTRRQIRLQTQRVETRTRQRVQTRLVLTDRLQQLTSRFLVQLQQLRLHLGVHGHRVGRGHQLAWLTALTSRYLGPHDRSA